MRRRCLSIRIAAFVAVAAALAAGKVGPEFQVNTYTTGDQTLPAVAMNPDGGFVVVWDSGPHALDTSGHAIIGRRFDASGNPLSGEFLVPTTASGDQVQPSVSMNGGGFVVAWRRVSSLDCAVGRFDAAGTSLGPETQGCSTSSGAINTGSPAISMDAAGGFKVAHFEYHFYADSPVKTRGFDGSGNEAWPEVQLSTHGAFTQIGSNAAVGTFVVVWGEIPLGNYFHAYGRLFAANGQPLGSRFPMTSAPFDWDMTDEATRPSVTMDRHGDFLVVWERNSGPPQRVEESSPLGGQSEVLAAQRFDHQGHRLGSRYVVPFPASSRPRYPRVVGDDEGNYLVITSDTGGGGTGPVKIQGRVVDRANAMVGTEFTIFPSVLMNQGADVAGARSGDFVVVWSERDRDGSGSGIFAQRFCQHPSMESLRLAKIAGGTQIRATWSDVPNAEDYVLYEDPSVAGAFTTVTGTGTNGTTGLTTAMPATNRYYLLSGRSALCGEGTKR